LEIDTIQAVMLAGLLGVASVVERLARAFIGRWKTHTIRNK